MKKTLISIIALLLVVSQAMAAGPLFMQIAVGSGAVSDYTYYSNIDYGTDADNPDTPDSTSVGASDRTYASSITIGTGGCSANAMKMYWTTPPESPNNWRLIIYDDSGGEPNNQVSSTAEQLGGSSGAWSGWISISGSLSPSTQYHIAQSWEGYATGARDSSGDSFDRGAGYDLDPFVSDFDMGTYGAAVILRCE